jgi:hypothetical protein
MAMGGSARMVVTVARGHVVAVVVRMVIMPRRRWVVVASLIRMIGLGVVILRLHGSRRDDRDRHDGRGY